jgi:TolA-binding protein
MSNVIQKPPRRTATPRLTLGAIHQQLAALNQRVEDLEDLRQLNQAIERHATTPL